MKKVPTFGGTSRSAFQLTDDWRARRVPIHECPVPMAEVIENDRAVPELFSKENIAQIFAVMRAKGIRLLRRQIKSDDLLKQMPHLDFEIVTNETMSDDSKVPRNNDAHTAFIATEDAAEILMNECHHQIGELMREVPITQEIDVPKRWENVKNSAERYQNIHSYDALETLNGDIDWLMWNLHKITDPTLRILFIRLMDKIGNHRSALTIVQPNHRGQMIVFDNTAALHRGVDPLDTNCDFYSSMWHEDNFGYGLGFLYPRISDGVLLHGCSEDIIRKAY